MKQPSVYLKMRVLGAVDTVEGRTRHERVHHVAAMTFLDEDGNSRQFTWRTIQTWFYRYKNHGIFGMTSRTRSDKGHARKVTPEELLEAINAARPHFSNRRSNKRALYRFCIENGLLHPDRIAQTTFYRFIRDFNLLAPDDHDHKQRLAFSMKYANQLWQADTMFGPYCAFPHSGCISSRTLPNCHPICGRCLHREFGKRRYLAPRSRMIYRTPLPRSSPRRYNGDFSGGPPVGDQCWFSRDDGEWNAIAERLKQTPCPHCSRVGPLIRHGFLYGFDDSNPTGKTRRAHRVFCSNRNARPGCGRTFTVWLADKIRRLSLTTTALWQFLQRAAANGILDAIRARDGQRSDRTWQRVWKRFNLCQSKIRTALFGRCPPPDLPPQPPQRPAAQVVAHLQAAFPDSHCPITAFQHSLRTFFV